MAEKQKLELTWIGKGEEPKIEPRILLYDKEKSYGDQNTENMLIHGDNLLALKALEQDYAGRIKCIYIDPPYNTGSAFEHYDDNLQHSTWLNMMKPRLEELKRLLSEDGAIFIQIDDEEFAYLKILCDEVFERKNFVTSICVKMSHLSGVKMSHIDKKPPKIKEFILIYAKSKEKLSFNLIYEKANWDEAFDRYKSFVIKDESNPNDITKWKVKPLRQIAIEKGIDVENKEEYEKYCISNANNIFRTARNRSKQFDDLPNDSMFREIITSSGLKKLTYKREEVLFCKEKMKMIDNELVPAKPLGDIWTDIGINNLHNEGGVDFRNGKKPEKLISRIIEMITNDGDYVLDSFLGSGTTAAVAHKMNRKWIGIELGDHCYTHCMPRLENVVDGTDQGGISKSTGWKGGGGFKFYELAPSLLKKDKHGNWVIDKDHYNPEMLAAAVAKLNGYKYAPDEEVFWKQGKSHENSYIFTTTQYVSAKYLDMLANEMHENEKLLICCPAFDVGLDNRYENIIVKKIPQSVLNKCDFGISNYNMSIVDLSEYEQPEVYDE